MQMEIADQEMRELQRDYLVDVREKLSLIRQHGESLSSANRFKSSFPVLLYLAHQLKGSGGSLGFPRITDVARTITTRLNEFLDESARRPTPAELSHTVLLLANDLEGAVSESEKTI